MKVLFVLDLFPPHIGGAETLFDNITSNLAQSGIEVSILTQRLPGTSAFEISKNRKIYRVYSPIRHTFAAAAAKKCVELAKNVDIVHAATMGGLATVAFIEKLTKKPVVATVFEVWDKLFLTLQKPPVSIINYAIENVSLDHYKNHFCAAISESTKSALVNKGFNRGKISVIYPGIDKNLFNPLAVPSIKNKNPTIIFLGRPAAVKGVHHLINAMPRIVSKLPNVRLLLLLSKNPQTDYKKAAGMVKKLGLQENVKFLDSKPVKELPGIIRSADVCVVPSLSEGFGLSAAESVSCGVPVIASSVGSLPEIIKNGFNGILCAPADPASIAENVIKVLSDKKLKRYLASNGPRSVKKFDWKRGTKQYIKLYKSALK
ncbi:MAG: glycosyltransferase family 4 protein [Candidatus Aenigmarchaeota archaeon]|nr:glycosyltransferase family 4 protein [Candidatus Aenigmarchaeota archaeon]